MIGAVLLEEIYYILKDKQNFDEQKYKERLSRLGRDIEVGENGDFISVADEDNIQELLPQIAYNTEASRGRYCKKSSGIKRKQLTCYWIFLKK